LEEVRAPLEEVEHPACVYRPLASSAPAAMRRQRQNRQDLGASPRPESRTRRGSAKGVI
jgi:hypothetical protein